MSSNIVAFPGFSKPHPPQNEEEFDEHITSIREKFVTEAAVEFAFEVFRNMEKHGCDINTNKAIRPDLILISESIKSAMFKSFNMDHPLQSFAHEVISEEDSDIGFEDSGFGEDPPE